jgi:hypothetical protein
MGHKIFDSALHDFGIVLEPAETPVAVEAKDASDAACEVVMIDVLGRRHATDGAGPTLRLS